MSFLLCHAADIYISDSWIFLIIYACGIYNFVIHFVPAAVYFSWCSGHLIWSTALALQQCPKSWHWDGCSFFDEQNTKINVVWQIDIDLRVVYQQGALFATISCSPISLHSSGARWWTVCPRFPVGELWVPWDVLFILLGSVLWMQSREG